MLFIMFGIIGAVVGGMRSYRDEFSGAFDLIGMAIVGFFAGLLCAYVLMYVVIAITFPYVDEVESDSQPLYALGGSTQASGQFVLGCGTVEGKWLYTYMIRVNDRTQVKTLSATDVYMVETDEREPILITYDLVFKSKLLRWLFGDNLNHQVYYFYIPNGSIQYKFNVKVTP